MRKGVRKGWVEVREDWCKGCAICVLVCPKGVLGMAEEPNARGYRVAGVLDAEGCTACLLCERLCPDLAITVETM